jgi:hypothetical protein
MELLKVGNRTKETPTCGTAPENPGETASVVENKFEGHPSFCM